jgi:LysM repeat protein
MADTDTAESSGSAFGFLGHKIAGKVPVWIIAVAAIGGYYWYTRYGPGKSAASPTTATSMTDPAGNVGVIDPATGFVYGSPEDLAAISAGGQGGGDDGSGGWQGSGTPSPSPSPAATAPVPVVKPAPAPPLVTSRKPPILTPSRGTSTTSYTVKKGDTLASVAAKYHITVGELAGSNVYVAGEVPGNAKVGQKLGTGAGLKTGQVLKVP